MGSVFDAMAYYLSTMWNERYAERWLAFMLATHNGQEEDLVRACRFWVLELSAVDTESTREIREHLTPDNNLSVIMNIFKDEIIPVLQNHESEFLELSRVWGSVY